MTFGCPSGGCACRLTVNCRWKADSNFAVNMIIGLLRRQASITRLPFTDQGQAHSPFQGDFGQRPAPKLASRTPGNNKKLLMALAPRVCRHLYMTGGKFMACRLAQLTIHAFLIERAMSQIPYRCTKSEHPSHRRLSRAAWCAAVERSCACRLHPGPSPCA